MAFNFVKKDITTVTKGLIAHGCNCRMRMGTGVALAIRNKWPKVYDEYSKLMPGPHWLGKTQVVKLSDHLHVVNMFTQATYGREQKKYADPKAIHDAFVATLSISKDYELPVYIPQIGILGGGLDWETEVFPALQKAVDKTNFQDDITVCIFP